MIITVGIFQKLKDYIKLKLTFPIPKNILLIVYYKVSVWNGLF